MIPMPSDTLEIALDFLKDHPDCYIFPIRRLEKKPPCFANELELASNDPKQIRVWARKYNGPNWGLSLKKSGYVVLDVDRKPGKHGQTTLDLLEMKHGALPNTLIVKSPSGGLHIYFKEANGVKHRALLGKFGFGSDLDSPNYVLLPGCWLSNGTYYQVAHTAPVADTPEWFTEYLPERNTDSEAGAVDQGVPEIELDKPANIAQAIHFLTHDARPSVAGQNGEYVLLMTAGTLKDMGISPDLSVELLAEHYNVPKDPKDPFRPYCDPLWQVSDGALQDRLDVKVRNAWNYLRTRKPGADTAEAELNFDAAPFDEESKKSLDRQVQDAYAARQAKEREEAATEKARNDAEIAEVDADEKVKADAGLKPTDLFPLAENEPTLAEILRVKENSSKPNDPQSPQHALCREWVWAVRQERFISRRDPSRQLKASQFDSMFNPLAAGKASMAKVLFARSKPLDRFSSLAFQPGVGEVLPHGLYNVYRASAIKPKEGDTRAWNEHLNYLFQNENDRNLILNWMAWVLQNPTLKPNHALLLVGKETGTGKSFVARVMEQLIGPHNTQRPKNSSMGGDFNSWLLNCRLCIIEEVYQVGRRENLNAMRDLITEARVEVNIKGIPAFPIDNYVCIIGVSNHPDALPLDETDRRWLVIQTYAQPMGPEYYNALFPILTDPDTLSAIYHELMHRDLNGYTGYQRPVETAAKRAMIDLSRSDAETWLHESLNSGPLDRTVVCVNDIKAAMPAELWRQARLSTAVIPTFLRDKCGGTRTDQVRLSDGTKARLWILYNRAPMFGGNVAQIAATYEKERAAGLVADAKKATDDFAA